MLHASNAMPRLSIFITLLSLVAIACSNSSSSSATYDCNGGFPSVGDSCPTEGQECEEEGPPCPDGEVSSVGGRVDICKGGQLVLEHAPDCTPVLDAGAQGDAQADVGTSSAADAPADASDDAG